MRDGSGPSRTTGEGQMIAFAEGLSSLTGRRRTVARVVVALLLVVGGGVGVLVAARAFSGAFG